MLKRMRPESVAEQVLAGLLLVVITAVLRHLAQTAALWVQWGLWSLLIAATAVALAAVALAVLGTWRKSPLKNPRPPAPVAWLPGSPDAKSDSYLEPNRTRKWDVLWPEVASVAEFDLIQVTLMFVPSEPGAFMAAGIELTTAGPGRIVLYLVRDAREGDGIRLFEVGEDSQQFDGRFRAGEWYTLRIEKRQGGYSAFVDGVAVFESRPLQVPYGNALADLWPERAVTKVRFNTDAETAKVAVLQYDYRRQGKQLWTN